jgi:UDP-N-acetylmuramoyl-tripeptide--D-alanyl-D-alanine ligase
MNLSARDLSLIPHIEFRNRKALGRRRCSGVSTDSRTTGEGELFVALRGERFDGHAFLSSVFARGAFAAVVDRKGDISAAQEFPLLVVEDTIRALGELAHLYRKKFDIPVLAIGGSNGKTTTKEMIAGVLGAKYQVLSTEGNHNNHIGVPQTVFRLSARHEVAVVEIGTNHPGEIANLCWILQPTHGLITNIGREHLEYFRTIEGVADEEGRLFESIHAIRGGMAIVNADDARVVSRAHGIKKVRTYGFHARGADVRGRMLGTDTAGRVRMSFRTRGATKETMVQLGIPGEHTARNALAAIAAGVIFRVPPARIREVLESLNAPTQRMEVSDLDGITVLNDAYNANPDSVLAAVRTLDAVSGAGKKIVVLGDMLELGDVAEEEHRRVGKDIAAMRYDYLLSFGPMMKYLHEESDSSRSTHFEQKNMLAEYLAELLSPGDTVLVKGSRGMKMEDVITFLRERAHAPSEVRP